MAEDGRQDFVDAVMTPESIHAFWFGAEADDALVAQHNAALWWKKDARADDEIRRRFEPGVQAAARHELDSWSSTAAGCLALILLTDQFPRNMYRDTPQAFAFDLLARGWCRQGLQAGLHRLLRPIERVFFYLPLEHSESLADQEQCIALFRALLDELDAARRPAFEGFLDYALRHREVIARFGRFPHRNRILGRASTPEETAFLAQPGSSF
ncbi:MAG TPA: DUF924 family protein [Noviherbaspirillum sp.]|uniref:DUF924 family protein n=1 Tax=Noviherbaspirillum sp. TaxID=1926288 RepID=UPI002B473DD2|nr:DUF924 family protein [Noviherbaspirillum sp.]HJV87670.1 DUF924 family protein [Noviherbaspirillum sp.]